MDGKSATVEDAMSISGGNSRQQSRTWSQTNSGVWHELQLSTRIIGAQKSGKTTTPPLRILEQFWEKTANPQWIQF